ncbi:PREDICTED: uncharacterized protein LOC108563980 isoform X2 [Nicrophorus vespilloides]|uniref:Uncharacterized protein LOC108563980 isoform X2 n=1 Tax=Nicrophorus vespilloides TaxID=110193 RepID=A0ABM1MUT0_NICVS|nr:PREDICTED: uncharacterized protein LOC108563980 isoform X2 [Nicrophorus vespilloides]
MNNCSQKVKRKTIPLETKILILKRLENGEGSTAVANEFKLGESTIRAIQKRASKINESINSATNESSRRASYSRNIVIERTEQALVFWMKDLTNKGIPIHGDLIREKAREYFNQLKDLEPSSSSSCFDNLKFSASKSWLTGFLRRYALHNVKIQGEAAASADETGAKNYCKVLAKVIDDGGHCPDQDDTEEVHIEGENSEGSENGSIKQSMQEIDEMYESNSKQIKLSPSSRLKSANYPPQDEFQLFGQSIAVQLKNLSTKRSIYAQNEIQAILTRHRLLDLHDKENQNTEILNQDFSEKIKTEIVDQEIENREISNSDIFKPETNLNQSTDTSEELMGNEDIKIEYNYDEYHLNDNSMITASEKNSRKCYTAAEKLLVIEYAETNGNRDASRHFSVNESNVRFWRKNKEAIQVLPRKKKASRGHPPSFPHLENALVKWVVDRRQMGIRVPRIDIKLKALELKESLLGTEEFKASYGWAVRFMKRHGLDEEEEDLGSLKRDNEEGCGVSVADRTILEPSDTNNTKFLMDAADIKVETDS